MTTQYRCPECPRTFFMGDDYDGAPHTHEGFVNGEPKLCDNVTLERADAAPVAPVAEPAPVVDDAPEEDDAEDNEDSTGEVNTWWSTSSLDEDEADDDEDEGDAE